MPKKRKIAVIGLGTIGLVIAYSFSQKYKVIGFDINLNRINLLKEGVDCNGLVTPKMLRSTEIEYTTDESDLNQADFYIIAVPTPITLAKKPDLSLLLKASETVGKYLKKGDIVVYESTVYPGATEEDCIPVLERISGLKSPKDFCVGYSPERFNPGDKEHHFSNVKKVVSAQTESALKIVTRVYESVIQGGVLPVSRIKIAEATKVIENTQRDVEIGFINEIALMLHGLDINTKEVFAAMSTKWNYQPFFPGLVGGNCIGIDSYYLIYKSYQTGYIPDIIKAARRVNDSMSQYITEQTIKLLAQNNINIRNANVGVFGVTFKDDYSETENSLVFDLIRELKLYRVNCIVHDPIANPIKVKETQGIILQKWEDIPKLDAIIFAVAHKKYRELTKKNILNKLKNKAVVIDVKSILKSQYFFDTKVAYWQL